MFKKLLLSPLLILCVTTGYASERLAVETISNTTVTESCLRFGEEYLANKISEIADDCAEVAGESTEKIYASFDKNQFDENTDYKINNAKIRVWYHSFLKEFNDDWKNILSDELASGKINLEVYAKIAYEVRHQARLTLRKHMSDLKGLEKIRARDFEKYGNHDGPSFEWLLDRQLEKQKAENKEPNLDKAYRSIISSSTRTNSLVNTFMYCYDYLSETSCDYVGDTFARFMDAA